MDYNGSPNNNSTVSNLLTCVLAFHSLSDPCFYVDYKRMYIEVYVNQISKVPNNIYRSTDEWNQSNNLLAELLH
jgi:hypothetical protein